MYAIVEIGGSQWKVEKNDEILVDLITDKKGASLKYNTVTMLRDDKKVEIGQPYVSEAVVEAKLIDPLVKGEKLHVYKYKNKTNYHVKTGHRQKYSMIQITNISTSGSSTAKTTEKTESKAVEKEASAVKSETATAKKASTTKSTAAKKPAVKKAAPKTQKASE